MKKLSVLLALAIFSSLSIAHASDPVKAMQTHNDFSFTISSMSDDGTETVYNADAVEQFTQDFLAHLGATNINVNVPSADVNNLVWNPMVSVTFDSVRKVTPAFVGNPLDADYKTVTLKGSDNGLLAQGVMNAVKDHFDFSSVTGPSNDLNSNSPYHYDVTALFAR